MSDLRYGPDPGKDLEEFTIDGLRTKVKALEEEALEHGKKLTEWNKRLANIQTKVDRLTAERDAKEDILQRFRRYRRCEDTIANAWNALDAHDAERAEVVTTGKTLPELLKSTREHAERLEREILEQRDTPEVVTTKHPSTKTKAITVNPDE